MMWPSAQTVISFLSIFSLPTSSPRTRSIDFHHDQTALKSHTPQSSLTYPARFNSTFAPLLPPAIPLAVRSPYLNAWLPSNGEDGANGYLAGSWTKHWPIKHPDISWKQYTLGWSGLISINGEVYEFLGDPINERGIRSDDENSAMNRKGEGRKQQQHHHHFSSGIGTMKKANQTAFEYTATKSIFSFSILQPSSSKSKKDHAIHFNVTFFSPVEPTDYLRLSLPLSYMSVEVEPSVALNNKITVYSDITGEWASGDSDVDITWDYTVHAKTGLYQIQRKHQMMFAEVNEQAEWGSAIYAVDATSTFTTSSGYSHDLRSYFVKHSKMSGTQDIDYRAINDEQPAFGFAVELDSQNPKAVFVIGHMREDYVNYVTRDGQIHRKGYWSTAFDTIPDAVSFFTQDYQKALLFSNQFDAQLFKDSVRVTSSPDTSKSLARGAKSTPKDSNYASIVMLSTRQAFATFELTVSGKTMMESGRKEEDILAFLKEISSNGDMSTVDVTFPLHPILIYYNPEIIKFLLDPIMIYTDSGLYPNKWTVHDLGRYPNATGYNDGRDESMPVEEAGNMLWMILAYYQMTEDAIWVSRYYHILTQWTTFLIDDGLIPAEQLSTDDFAGTLSNQTNLAIKAIVGIGAMAKLSQALGRYVEHIHYDATARAYAEAWYDLALTAEPVSHPHAKLAYQDQNSYGLLYNLFGDRLLNLKIFDKQLYAWQSAWYWKKKNKYGVPLDSRHLWTKTDWEMFAAASASDAETRDMFVDSIVRFLKAGVVDSAFPDLYETDNADFPSNGPTWSINFIARPVVGGHFSLLALDAMDRVNGVKKSHFPHDRVKDYELHPSSSFRFWSLSDSSATGPMTWSREM